MREGDEVGELKIKRVYDDREGTDGYRLLVDRLWPRGIRKESLHLDEWGKFLAPSTELCRRFDHRPERFESFREDYRAELNASEEASTFLKEVGKLLNEGAVTLLYGAKDTKHNQAVVLQEWILEKLRS